MLEIAPLERWHSVAIPFAHGLTRNRGRDTLEAGVGIHGHMATHLAPGNGCGDRTSRVGVRHIDTPLTAEKIWRALQRAGGTAGAIHARSCSTGGFPMVGLVRAYRP